MLDDLRKSALESDERDYDEEDRKIDAIRDRPQERPFLGMRPVERMFLSIFLFMTATVLVLAMLLATGRLVL